MILPATFQFPIKYSWSEKSRAPLFLIAHIIGNGITDVENEISHLFSCHKYSIIAGDNFSTLINARVPTLDKYALYSIYNKHMSK